MSLFVISHHQAYALVGARRKGQATAKTSPDLTLTTVEAVLDEGGVTYPDPWNIHLTWDQLEPIAKDETHCFKLEEGELVKIHTFSEVTNRAISLYPTAAAPTMVLAGFPMHRIKDTNPYKDTLAKIKAASPVTGVVLDTATGLGYTATQAAKTAQQVYTCEIDPSVLEICAQNPWSQDLFNNPKITQLQGDAFDLIEEMDAGMFSRVIHDPPTVQLAGHLYSGDFYAEVYRVLKPGGRLFHYIGDPNSSIGSRMTRGVVKRLQEAGFRSVRPAAQAYGVIADK